MESAAPLIPWPDPLLELLGFRVLPAGAFDRRVPEPAPRQHPPTPSALWTTPHGITLVIKPGMVAVASLVLAPSAILVSVPSPQPPA